MNFAVQSRSMDSLHLVNNNEWHSNCGAIGVELAKLHLSSKTPETAFAWPKQNTGCTLLLLAQNA